MSSKCRELRRTAFEGTRTKLLVFSKGWSCSLETLHNACQNKHRGLLAVFTRLHLLIFFRDLKGYFHLIISLRKIAIVISHLCLYIIYAIWSTGVCTLKIQDLITPWKLCPRTDTMIEEFRMLEYLIHCGLKHVSMHLVTHKVHEILWTCWEDKDKEQIGLGKGCVFRAQQLPLQSCAQGIMTVSTRWSQSTFKHRGEEHNKPILLSEELLTAGASSGGGGICFPLGTMVTRTLAMFRWMALSMCIVVALTGLSRWKRVCVCVRKRMNLKREYERGSGIWKGQ